MVVRRGRRGRGRAGQEQMKMLANEFRVRSTRSHEEMLAISRHFGQLLKRRVIAKSSGRPGPKRVTGDYHRDMFYDVLHSPRTAQVVVGVYPPSSDFAKRLEFGFVGTDTLGRHVNAPPYEHFGPAADESVDDYYAAVSQLADFDNRIIGS